MAQRVAYSTLKPLVDTGQITAQDLAAKVQAGEIEIVDDSAAAPQSVADQARARLASRGLTTEQVKAGQGVSTPADFADSPEVSSPITHMPGGDSFMKRVAVGAGKGILSTAHTIDHAAVGSLYRLAKTFGYHDPDTERFLADNADYKAALEAKNPGEMAGKVAEQVGEFALGSAAVKGAVAGIPALARVTAAATPTIVNGVRQAVPLAARLAGAGLEVGQGALVGGGVTAIQGGDPKVGAIVGGAVPAVTEALSPLAGKLYESAQRSMIRAVGPTKEVMKNMATRVAGGYTVAGTEVPGLVERGIIRLTRRGLSAKAAQEVAELGDQIDNLWSTIPPGKTIPAAPIKQALADARAAVQETEQKTIGGVVKTVTTDIEPAHVANLNRMGKIVDGLTNDAGEMDVQKLRKVKGILDKIVASKGGYAGKMLSVADEAGVMARKELANSIREELAASSPDIAAVNKEFHFWKQVGDVVDETIKRTAPQSQPMGQQLARVAGTAAAHGSGAGVAIMTGEAMKTLRAFTTSTAWNTTSAAAKSSLADMLANGQTSKAVLAMKFAMQAGVSHATQPKKENP